MKKKLLGIFVCMLLFATVLPVAGSINENSIFEEPQNFIDDRKSSQTGLDDWPMFRHDSGNTGCSLSLAPNTNHLNWKKTIQEDIFSASPVVSDDKLFISTNWYYLGEPPNMTKSFIVEKPSLSEFIDDITTYNGDYYGGIYCLDADTGISLWNYPMYAPNDPAVVDDKVYVTDFALDSYNSSLYCLNTETGAKDWQKPIGGLVLSPTIVDDEKIFLGCLDIYNFNGSLKCFDLEGNIQWTYPMGSSEIMWFTAPAVSNGKVYFITSDMYSYSGKLYCLDAETGQFLWSKPLSGSWYWFGSSSPSCANGNVYAVDFNFYSYSGTLKCFNAETGEIKWTQNIGWSFSTPAVCEESIFVTGFDLFSYNSWLYRINAETGVLIWKIPIPDVSYFFFSSSPVAADGKVFISPMGYYSYSNTIYCYSMEDGSLVWSYALDDLTISALSIADERVYAADYSGMIYAIEDVLKIGDISGGLLSVKTEIKNIGDYDFTDVSWSISVTGGMLGMINRTVTRTISTLKAGDSKPVRAMPIFGIGKIQVTVTATMPINTIKKVRDGFVLGPLVIILS